MYILDTDSVSNYLDERRANPVLRDRIERQPSNVIYISIVTLEEIVKGIMALLNVARKQPRNAAKIIAYYALLHDTVRDLMAFQILPYDAAAETKYQTIPANVRQQHASDSHIVAIALSRGDTVITGNVRHSAAIPDLQYEDWTVE